MSESSGNTRAINRQNVGGSVDYGLFQVSPKLSVLFGKGYFEVKSNSQYFKSSLFCVVVYETLDTDSSEVQRSLPNSDKRCPKIFIFNYNGTSESTKKLLLLVLYSLFILYRPQFRQKIFN
jgi:hypothetical protein